MINKYVLIKEAFIFLKKSKIKAGEGLDNGKYPFYTSSPQLSKYLNKYEIKEESLIFGTGGVASIHHSFGKFSTSTDCYVLQTNGKYEIDLRFVYLFLRGNINILENGFKGAGLKHISKKIY
ncbi:MAG: restriction endonuclease subunit S [Caldicoprobacterales bacterium]